MHGTKNPDRTFFFIAGSFPSEPISNDEIKQLSNFILRLNVNRKYAWQLVPYGRYCPIHCWTRKCWGRLLKLKERVDQSDTLKPIQCFLNKEPILRWEFIYESSPTLRSSTIRSESDQVLSPSDIGLAILLVFCKETSF